ncbi:serine/arginine-rich splicing factor 4-like [Helianthus annuus]|uniref:serine/arginine-rich splicing factor 4-like n=1 Tax=Helianthus annuus TaxID=4232 RepID=UPI0016530769|nr:serine/arginine-rich splicing factor 4-like [Helianthus annuus]
MGHNPSGPEDHFPEAQDMEMDDYPDLAEPPSGTPAHPIEISDGSSFHGSPYRGPDSYKQSSYMAESEEVNSHPLENHEATRINITREELRTLIDTAVSKAVDRQFRESSGMHSKTSSVPHSKSHPKTHSEAHSKPPSKQHESKKDDVQHSSNQHSKDRLENSDAGKRKHEDDNSHHLDKKHKGNSEHKKSSGFKKDDQQLGEKPKCKVCKKRHLGRCRYESKSQSQPRACGICKSNEHKTLDCKKIKDATCYNCNEKGHINSNCPKYAKKPEEGKKTVLDYN